MLSGAEGDRIITTEKYEFTVACTEAGDVRPFMEE
jgi:hypothetical protein